MTTKWCLLHLSRALQHECGDEARPFQNDMHALIDARRGEASLGEREGGGGRRDKKRWCTSGHSMYPHVTAATLKARDMTKKELENFDDNYKADSILCVVHSHSPFL